MAEIIDFPAEMSENQRAKFCQMLVNKDNEINELLNKIDKLEVKYNCGLTYNESEELRTKVNIAEFSYSEVERQLLKRHLRIIKYQDPKSANVNDFKIIKISIFERIKTKLLKLLPFKLKLERNQ